MLKENHLAAKASKCEFHRPEVEFLGHVISGSGVKTDPKKISALKDWPTPSTVKEVQSFVGFCNYYRRFVKNFASIAKPLHNLTKKDSKFVWTDECNCAFLTLKDKLVAPRSSSNLIPINRINWKLTLQNSLSVVFYRRRLVIFSDLLDIILEHLLVVKGTIVSLIKSF